MQTFPGQQAHYIRLGETRQAKALQDQVKGLFSVTGHTAAITSCLRAAIMLPVNLNPNHLTGKLFHDEQTNRRRSPADRHGGLPVFFRLSGN